MSNDFDFCGRWPVRRHLRPDQRKRDEDDEIADVFLVFRGKRGRWTIYEFDPTDDVEDIVEWHCAGEA